MSWTGAGFSPAGLIIILALTAYLGYRRGAVAEIVGLVGLAISHALASGGLFETILTVNRQFIKMFLLIFQMFRFAGDSGEVTTQRAVEFKPLLNESNQDIVQVLVVLAVALYFYWRMAGQMKKKPSAWGALLGSVNGYLISALLLPMLPTEVPPPSGELVTTAEKALNPVLQLAVNNLTIVVLLAVALIIILAARAIMTAR